jgi:hypothetical protein
MPPNSTPRLRPRNPSQNSYSGENVEIISTALLTTLFGKVGKSAAGRTKESNQRSAVWGRPVEQAQELDMGELNVTTMWQRGLANQDWQGP